MRANSCLRSRRGSALLITICFTIIAGVLVASVLRWAVTERRLNDRHALRLETRNAAEAVAEYGFAQVRYKMDQRTSFPANTLNPSGADALVAPAAAFFAGSHVDPTTIEIVGGTARTITNDDAGVYFYVDPSDPNNEFDPMKGKRIFRRDVQILARVTGSRAWGTPITSYVGETLAMREAPLFSHAIFYNMDLELAPGNNMTIYGPVHSNGNLWVTGQADNGSALNFSGTVTVTNGLYWGYETSPKMGNGASEPTTHESINFINKAGSLINLRSGAGIWRDQKMGGGTETEATQSTFRSFASNTYNGNLQTGLHGVENYPPVAFDRYEKDLTPTDGVDQSVNTGRAMIEAPLSASDSGYNAAVENEKLARKAGLYIAVNPSSTARTARKPDGTTFSLPAGSYRAFKKDGTEIFLPGQAGHSVTGASATRAVVKIKTDQMTDLRRTVNFNHLNGRSTSNRYDPRSVDLIEVDMAQLKMAVERTVNGAATTSTYAYDSSSTDSAYKASSPTSVSLTSSHVIENFSAADWNGAVYIQSVDAESRKDSGVRLINGRGRVASKPANSAEEGLTLATNDAMYVLGHFNADGTVNTDPSSSSNSSRYAEHTTETPVALAADAITILSQPTFSSGIQNGGWNDVMSDLRISSSAYSTSWATTNPSSSNMREGTATSKKPGDTPLSTASSTSGSVSAATIKFTGQTTEISAALLTGIVPSNKNGNNQYSGGAHNFPRLLESWGSNALIIRGSMVALFESRIATEPWTIRVYNAPARYWGFHNMFAQGRYPPQTPRVRTYRRVDFRDLSPVEYTSAKSGFGW